MKTNTKTLALAGIFSSLVFLLAMTPLGLIPLGFINLTIVHVPVIIGTIVLGKRMGLVLGSAFGIASTLAAFGMSLAAQSSLAATLLSYSPLAVIIMSIIPRLLIPVSVYYTYNGLSKYAANVQHSRKRPSKTFIISCSAVVGSLTNTIGYLGLMGMFFAIYGIWGKFAGILTFTLFIGATCEAIAAAFIAAPVVSTIASLNDAGAPKTEKNEDVQTAQIDSDEFVEGVENVNVAVLPPTETLLPSMSDGMEQINNKAINYLNANAFVIAQTLFERLEAGFTLPGDVCKIELYIATRYVEACQYKAAAKKLVLLLQHDYGTEILNPELKKVLIGILNIIHTATMNITANNDAFALRTERVFDKLSRYIEMDSYILAAQMLEMYICVSTLA